MRHGKRKYSIGSSPSHRKSLLRNLAVEVIEHGRIKTTHTKCQAVRPFVEKLITAAKVDSVSNRRFVFRKSLITKMRLIIYLMLSLQDLKKEMVDIHVFLSLLIRE